MKKTSIYGFILIGFVFLIVFISRGNSSSTSINNNASTNNTNNNTSNVSEKFYSETFRVSGYYICYDGIHYKYHCSTVNDVKEIIKYYYPDCFDVTVYEPGTEKTGYINTIFYATWKSYLDYAKIE